MLPNDFKERILAWVQPRFDECWANLKQDVAQKREEIAARVGGVSSGMLTAVNKIFEQQIETRVLIVREAIENITPSMGISCSDTLAVDLKEILQYYVPISLWNLPNSYPQSSLQTKERILSELRQNLIEKRERELKKADGEIDLFVDSLRKKQASAPEVPQKVYEEKFGILLSPKQAPKDFDKWIAQVGSDGYSISILFIDIDDFKSLNTKYTETKIDKTVLPETMQLIASFIRGRGEVYKQGGDEFIVLLPNQDSSEANAVAERIRLRLEQHVFHINNSQEKLTISIGIASRPEHGASFDEILQGANDAKQEAKETKNTVKLFQSDSSDSSLLLLLDEDIP